MTFRMGVNLGDMSPADDTIHGDGVNIASRLEKLTEPGGVCIGRNVYDQMRGKLGYGFIDLGEQRVHNIAEPVHAYCVTLSKPVDEVAPRLRTRDALLPPNKPSIAVLPFAASLLSSDVARQGAADWPVLSIVGNAEAVQYAASTQIHLENVGSKELHR